MLNFILVYMVTVSVQKLLNCYMISTSSVRVHKHCTNVTTGSRKFPNVKCKTNNFIKAFILILLLSQLYVVLCMVCDFGAPYS